jgi:hypothetical protein
MASYNELLEFAKSQYTYKEIIATADFRIIKQGVLKDGVTPSTDWLNDQGPEDIYLMTTTEDDSCFDLSDSASDKRELNKLELIRILHAGGDWNLLQNLIASGTPLFRGGLAGLGQLRREKEKLDELNLEPEERLAYDPKFRELVARKREELEASRIAKKQLDEAEALTITRNLADMSEGDLSEFLGLIDWSTLWETDFIERWFVPNFICEGRAHSYYAQSGLGKSLLMQEIAVCLAAGKSALGFPPQAPIRVLYIDNENTPEGDVKPRIKAMGYDPSHLENLKYLSFPDITPLNTESGGEMFKFILDKFQPQLVFLDTFSRFLDGDENLSITAQKFYQWTGREMKKRGIAYVRIDHMGKDSTKAARGTSAKKDDVDLIWLMKEIETKTRFELINEKARVPIGESKFILNRNLNPLSHQILSGLDWHALIEFAERSQKATELVTEYAESNPKSRLGKTQIWNALQKECSMHQISRKTLWEALEHFKSPKSVPIEESIPQS